jgi:hypothetical protein
MEATDREIDAAPELYGLSEEIRIVEEATGR